MAGIAASAIGAVATASSARSAKKAGESQAATAAAESARQAAAQKPWVDAGTYALGQLTSGLQPGGQFTKPFKYEDSEAERVALEGGSRAIQNSAAARGGLLSTNTNQALTEFGQENATKFETNAFNRWQAERNAQMNPLFSMAGLGQQANTALADNQTNLALGGSAARAAGNVASSNIISNGISDQISMITKLFNPQSTPSYTTPGAGGGYNNPPGGGLGIGYTNTGDSSTSAGDYSDERLKKDIKRVGMTDDGIPIFTYRMKDGDERFKMGVMAHHIEERNPRAVTHDRSGFRMVDYGKI